MIKKKDNPLTRLEGLRVTVRGTVKKFRDSIEISAREISEPDVLEEIGRVKDEIEKMLK
ncbi:MAG: hypothetical protein HXY34_14100 [Candidatus Thorarchaeota archaeon]|nr:hypothetical protein [Candidatus Thorarchaeota archaeon]